LNKVVFSPKDSFAVSGGEDGIARVFDITRDMKFQQRYELKQHHSSIQGLVVTQDSTRVITSSADKSLRIYEVEKTGACVY
jgi:WD40 repeat protein